MESLRISWGVLGFVCLFVFKKKKKSFPSDQFCKSAKTSQADLHYLLPIQLAVEKL